MTQYLRDQLRRAQEPSTPANQNEASFYGLAPKGIKVPAVMFRFRDGRNFFLHYAYRFNMDMPSSGRLILNVVSARTRVTIEGRGLDGLAMALMTSSVTWVKESENPLIDDGENIFISSIKVEEKGFDE